MATTRLMTAEELLLLPDDHCLHELIRGELIELPFVSTRQGISVARIGSAFLDYAEAHRGMAMGPCGFLLEEGPDTVLAPDVVYLESSRLPPEDEQDGYPRVAPTVAVEYASPADPPDHLSRKMQIYLTAGVRRLLIVDFKDRTVSIHDGSSQPLVLAETDTFDGGEVMPGFRLPVAEFFRYTTPRSRPIVSA